jgi:excisionase family DNA binding protein
MSAPLVHSIPEACSITHTGRTALYEAIRSGKLRAVKRGKRTLILPEDLRRWVDSMPPVKVKRTNTKDDGGDAGKNRALSNAAA